MINKEIAEKIKPGATVKVFEKVKEKDKERLAHFQGLVIARKHGSEPGATFTVRTTIAGVGMEKVFPLHSPLIEKIEIINSPRKISRAKLYYVRELSRRQTQQKVGTAQ